MPTDRPLWQKIYYQPLYSEVAKTVGYAGFPFPELAQRLRPLADKYGAPRLRLVLDEILTFRGGHLLLRHKVRSLCWQLLGPPPEKWDSFYTHPDGTPKKRPKGRAALPDVPEFKDDPTLDYLQTVGNTELFEKLELARKNSPASDTCETANQAREAIPYLESMLLYRGMEIPPDEIRKTPKKPRRKRTAKQSTKKA